MQNLAHLLATHELLLLFVVLMSGLMLGRLEYRGMRLGVAGVLFAGLGLSAWLNPMGRLVLAQELRDFGLVVFVYCVGLTSAPGFFEAFRQRGLRLNLAVSLALVAGAALAVVGGRLLHLDRGHIAGVFCGALTNTPALAAAGDRLQGTAIALHPVLGYSLAYPFGVLGALGVFRALVALRGKELDAETTRQSSASKGRLSTANFQLTNAEICRHAIGELKVRDRVGVVISRLRRGQETFVPTKYTVLEQGDVVTAVGSKSVLPGAATFFGSLSSEHLESHRDTIDMRRILVSRRELVGKSLEELELDAQFNAQVTRLRRADLDLLPSEEMRLELGDRLRVVAPTERMAEISLFFGDSERDLAELDYVAFAIGIGVGLLLALVPFPIAGGALTLGIAGGPLVAALVLGRFQRTGPLVWQIPYEANHALRELGLLLFLAGVGVSAGGQLTQALGEHGLAMLALGAGITLLTTLLLVVLLRSWIGAGVVTTLGVSSGMQTQPATLAAAHELSHRSEQTYVAYAIVYPVAMIGKILLAQLIVLFA